MRYLRQICSIYPVAIKVFITLHFRYPVVKRTPYKMATPREKAQCVCLFIETKTADKF